MSFIISGLVERHYDRWITQLHIKDCKMTEEGNQSDILVYSVPANQDHTAALICTWIFYSVGCQSINIFGIITNIINIICFAKLGFKDSINVSLLGIVFM